MKTFIKACLIYLAFCIILSCTNNAKQAVQSDNVNFNIELLFEVDGCKVYRFMDAGYYRYFSNCKGDVSWTEKHGKNNYQHQSIPTR